MNLNKGYWIWWWGFDQDKPEIHSNPKIFSNFEKMKSYSSKHSFKYQWVGEGYWSNYIRIHV